MTCSPASTALTRCLDVVRAVEPTGEPEDRSEDRSVDRSVDGSADDLELLTRLRTLEQLVCAAQAAQARVTRTFVTSRRARADRARDDDCAAGTGPRVADRRRREAEAAITLEVAQARRVSPHRAGRQIGLAAALTEMPHTAAAFDAGDLTEHRATIVAQETACLTRDDRATVDAELARRSGGAAGLGERRLQAEAARLGYRLDPYAAARRASNAESDRRVTLRPAPDTMARLSALVPVRDGVACLAALTRRADALRASGDERGRGQAMADTLVELLTRTTDLSDEPADSTTVEVQVVMSADALFGDGAEPAHVPGHGPVPAPSARRWISDTDARVFLRRLYTDRDGRLVDMDSRRRLFTGALRRFLVTRDDGCRTPWCDAPVRQLDHVVDAADGGPTSTGNAQGLCERCHHAKHALGWHSSPSDDGTVETTTPAGWQYRSAVPPPPVRPQPDPPDDLDDLELDPDGDWILLNRPVEHLLIA